MMYSRNTNEAHAAFGRPRENAERFGELTFVNVLGLSKLLKHIGQLCIFFRTLGPLLRTRLLCELGSRFGDGSRL
jgi:hypothetical protein